MAAIGIDLGTTNSLVAVYEGDKPRLIKNALGGVLTPSAVSLDAKGELLVGEAARDRLISHSDRSVASFKRFMGTSNIATLGRRSFRPEELSALILTSLKADAEADLGQQVTEAVISVPAYFNDPQRKATMDAARLAGLEVERLVNEPTAAALAYGLGQTPEGKFLIFDLGGGTFDVSILDKYEDVMEIRATTGDTRLGGDDFTRVVEQMLVRLHTLQETKLPPADRARLLRQADLLKQKLTSQHEAGYDFELSSGEVKGNIGRAAFETECAPLLQRLRLPTERAVRDSRLTPEKFDAVVMVGGATRMPMVRSLVAKLFGRLPLITIDPDTTIALGAAVQAGLVKRHGALRDVVMTDVCPYTLGVATVDDADNPMSRLSVQPVIERNAVVPISRNLLVSTVQDKQKMVAVEVYQGENLRPENNVLLGSIDVAVPSGPRGKESIDIRFTYDVNGALQVEAKVMSTGKTMERIFRNSAGLSEAELRSKFASLREIKLHPREHQENRALIARAERIYEEQRGEGRDEIRNLIGQFEREIGNQQLRDPAACRQWFAEQLNALDTSPFGAN